MHIVHHLSDPELDELARKDKNDLPLEFVGAAAGAVISGAVVIYSLVRATDWLIELALVHFS